MHKPKLGTYPLTLRDANIKVPKRGELLYDYTDSNVESTIYYIDRETLEKINLFESSINNIKEANLENTDIIVVKDTDILLHYVWWFKNSPYLCINKKRYVMLKWKEIRTEEKYFESSGETVINSIAKDVVDDIIKG